MDRPLPDCSCGAAAATIAFDGTPTCAACAAREAADPVAREESAAWWAEERERLRELRAAAGVEGEGAEGITLRPAPKLPTNLPPDTPAARLARALELRRVYPHRASLDAGLSRGAARWILDHPAESPRVSTLAALARALRVDPAWIAFGGDYPAPAAEELAPRAVEGLDASPPAEGEQLAGGVPLGAEEQLQRDPADTSASPVSSSHPEEHPAPLDAPPSTPAPVSAEDLTPATVAPSTDPAKPAGGVPTTQERAPSAPASRPSPSTGAGVDLAERSEALRARWRATSAARQHDFATRTGRSQSTLSRWLSGAAKVGAPDTLDAVESYLGALDAEHAARAASQTALPLDASRA